MFRCCMDRTPPNQAGSNVPKPRVPPLGMTHLMRAGSRPCTKSTTPSSQVAMVCVRTVVDWLYGGLPRLPALGSFQSWYPAMYSYQSWPCAHVMNSSRKFRYSWRLRVNLTDCAHQSAFARLFCPAV